MLGGGGVVFRGKVFRIDYRKKNIYHIVNFEFTIGVCKYKIYNLHMYIGRK